MKNRIKLSTKKTLQLAVLVAASTGVGAREAYVPYPDMKPNSLYQEDQYKAFVKQNYLGEHEKGFAKRMPVWIEGMSTKYKVCSGHMSLSDKRKQEILQKIAATRSAIRNQVDQFHKNQAAENMLKTIACTMENRTLNRDRELKHERAQQLHVPARLILVDVLRKRKGMPVVDLSEV